MRTYYEDEHTTIYLGDCLDVIPALGERFDLVVTSPPYNLGMGLDDVPVEAMHDRRSVSRKGKAANRLSDGYAEHDDAMPQAEYVEWQQQVLGALWEGLADDGAIFYNHKPRIQGGLSRFPTVFIPDHVTLRQVIIWNRVEKAQNYTEWAMVAACEWIMLLAKPGYRFPSRGHSAASDVWTIHPERGQSDHPCPFPVAVPARAIAASDPRLVLDPYCGSGSTLVAAKQAGVRSVGIEKSERYCEMAVTRLRNTTINLFAAPAPVEQHGFFD